MRDKTSCTQPYVMACDTEKGVEDLYPRIQLLEERVERLNQELEEEIVERHATAGKLRVMLTKKLAASPRSAKSCCARMRGRPRWGRGSALSPSNR